MQKKKNTTFDLYIGNVQEATVKMSPSMQMSRNHVGTFNAGDEEETE